MGKLKKKKNKAIRKKAIDHRKNESNEENLTYESKAYEMIHFINVDYPSLSFDIVKDDFGNNRKKFPHKCFLVGGSQAPVTDENFLMVMKLSKMHRTMYDSDDSENEGYRVAEVDMSDGEHAEPEESEMECDDYEDNGEDADLDMRRVRLSTGSVNRLSAMPQDSNVVAMTCENNTVYIYNIFECINSFNFCNQKNSYIELKSMFQFSGHRSEGYAVAWSKVCQGRLASGDGNGEIFVWNPNQNLSGGWSVNRFPLKKSEASVEDIKWSPVEENIFCAASTDKSLRVWDVRTNQCVVDGIDKHDCDVNVISWNQNVTNLLASGDDRGIFKIWDLRQFDQPTFTFSWHNKAITSIEWNPNSQSELIVSSEDDSITLWDLSVIEEEENNLDHKDTNNSNIIPQQLLFVHKGQKEIKEIHWHPQIPNVIVSTAYNGYNIWKPNLSIYQ